MRKTIVILLTLLATPLLTVGAEAIRLGCLLNRADGSVFDLDTGAGKQGNRLVPYYFGDAHNLSFSPDHANLAFVEDQDSGAINLRLKSWLVAEPGDGVVFHQGHLAPTAGSPDRRFDPVQFAWTPDSHLVAFAYANTTRQAVVGVADASGSVLKLMTQDLKDGERVGISGANSLNIAVYKQSATQLTLMFLSIPTLKTVWSTTLAGTCLMCGDLSPDSKQLAYVVFDEAGQQSAKLLLLSLDTHSEHQFMLGFSSVDPVYTQWSPDSRHLGVMPFDSRELGVYGIDGAAVSKVAPSPLYYEVGETGAKDPFYWRQDSTAIFYTQASGEGNELPYQVSGYFPDENRYVDIFDVDTIEFAPGNDYVFLEWPENGGNVYGIGNTLTGKQVSIAPVESNSGHIWIDRQTAWVAWSDDKAAYSVLMRADGSHKFTMMLPGELHRYNCNNCEGGGDAYMHQDVVSPDKKWIILYTETNGDKEHNGERRRWLVNVENGHYRLLPDANADIFFSPDSRMIAALKGGAENGDASFSALTLIPVDREPITPITLNDAITSFVWSPDGSKVGYAYVNGNDTGFKVYSRDGKLLKAFDSLPLDITEFSSTGGTVDALTWLPCR